MDYFPAGAFTEGTIYMARGIAIRDAAQAAPGLPNAPYIENFGVKPDIQADYMTPDNLINKGSTFVKGFADAMVNYVKTQH